MRVLARPLRADGSEPLGTEGTVSGDYKSVATFLRYNRKYLTNPHGYVIFRNNGGGSFTELARTGGQHVQ